MQPLAASPTPDNACPERILTALPQKPSPAQSAKAQEIAWRIHLLREEPTKAAGVFAAALLSGVCALIVFHSLVFALVSAALPLVAVSEYLLPLHYSLDSAGARVSCGPVEWLEMRWESVNAVYRTPYGLKLSPFQNPENARLEPCRGIRLRVPPGQRGKIEATIANLRGENS